MTIRRLPQKLYPLAKPRLGPLERKFLIQAFDSGWISSKGPFVSTFERSFAKYVGKKFGVSTSSGTSALHLALLAVGVRKGDEVIVPDLTFVSPANMVAQAGATPVFADSNRGYWGVDAETIRRRISKRTKAVIVVHLYGHPVDIGPIEEICAKSGICLIEDCAEAHGAEYKGSKVGSFGKVSCFSFYGNKLLTTGEGGMCLTDDDDLEREIRLLHSHAQDPTRHFWHSAIGYNYRMTNLQAAIGLAQLQGLEKRLSAYRHIAKVYAKSLGLHDLTLHPQMPWAKCVYWMYTVLIPGIEDGKRDELIVELEKSGIETRPAFYPLSKLPPYRANSFSNPIAASISKRGISLPTYVDLNDSDIHYISDILVSTLTRLKNGYHLSRSPPR